MIEKIRSLLPLAAVILVAVVGVVVLAALLFWIWPLTESSRLWNLEPSERADVTGTALAARGLVIQILGGLFLAGTLVFTFVNFQHSREELQASREELRVSREGQITERFTRATDQLGSENLMTRLGGIYALERIARDSDVDHWPVMEILMAFVRQNAVKPRADGSKDQAIIAAYRHKHEPLLDRFARSEDEISGVEQGLREDIQAALTVIGRRDPAKKSRGYEFGPIVLWGANLGQADLTATHLEGARLTRTHLEDARLVKAHLERANLWEARLEGANLTLAHLEGAILWNAHLEGANLTLARLEGADLTLANLEGARLWNAHLEGAKLAHVEGLTQQQIDRTYMNEETVLPSEAGPDGQPYRRSTRRMATPEVDE